MVSPESVGFYLFWPFCCFYLFVYLLNLFVYFDFFVAEFACVSSPPHFLFCSPVTLINFWPVDSAWVLPLKGAAPTHTFACWFFLVSLFCLKDIPMPPPFISTFFLPLVTRCGERPRPTPIGRSRARCSGPPNLGTFEPAEVPALSPKERQRNYWVVSCIPGKHVYMFLDDKQGRAFQLHKNIL